jgi:SAM-dependent methyltransferase
MIKVGRHLKKMLPTLRRLLVSRIRIIEPLLVINDMIADDSRVLDLGCGDGETTPLRLRERKHASIHIGLDSHLGSLKTANGTSTFDGVILADACALPFKTSSFDSVVAVDVIEHVDKQAGWALLREAERVAVSKVVILTPNGFVPQEPYDDNPFQRHNSGWETKDFTSHGYRVWGMNGFKELMGERARPRVRPFILGLALVYITELVVWSRAEKAFHILAVRENS